MEKSFSEMIEIIKRSIEKCPWIKKQTVESLKDEVVSEANELREAIEKNDHENIKEEIGDLIYDTCLIAAIAERDGILDSKETIQTLIKKIKRRKSWLFDDNINMTEEEARRIWYDAKEKEKKD